MGEVDRNLKHAESPFSPPIDGRRHGSGSFSMVHFDLSCFDDRQSPIMLLDDFTVSSRPFGPHPHAGFSAITYVFEDSPGALRSRDSLGNDFTVGAGGIVWLQAGRGALHEETPNVTGRALHGAQIYVNLHAANKNLAPRTFCLQAGDVPHWSDAAGNCVRVLVGEYRCVTSPLVPTEPFSLFDLRVKSRVTVDLTAGHHSLLYARDAVTLSVLGETQKISAGQVVSVKGGNRLNIDSTADAKLLLLSGASIREPRHVEGSFILNHAEDMNEIISRYRSGEMGHLAPRR